jgi:hypothetical protein
MRVMSKDSGRSCKFSFALPSKEMNRGLFPLLQVELTTACLSSPSFSMIRYCFFIREISH